MLDDVYLYHILNTIMHCSSGRMFIFCCHATPSAPQQWQCLKASGSARDVLALWKWKHRPKRRSKANGGWTSLKPGNIAVKLLFTFLHYHSGSLWCIILSSWRKWKEQLNKLIQAFRWGNWHYQLDANSASSEERVSRNIHRSDGSTPRLSNVPLTTCWRSFACEHVDEIVSVSLFRQHFLVAFLVMLGNFKPILLDPTKNRLSKKGHCIFVALKWDIGNFQLSNCWVRGRMNYFLASFSYLLTGHDFLSCKTYFILKAPRTKGRILLDPMLTQLEDTTENPRMMFIHLYACIDLYAPTIIQNICVYIYTHTTSIYVYTYY